MAPAAGPAAERDAARIALGCAQLGTAYGIANTSGQMSAAEAGRILALGADAGMDTLDTAIAYGSSEARLGEIGVRRWRVVSKMPPLPVHCPSIAEWVHHCVTGSLQRLRVKRLYGLLLHRSADLLSACGAELHEALLECRREGLVEKIGVSIYAPAELDALAPVAPVDLVQAPFNLIDRRLEESGWLARLAAGGVEVHVRSAFLQGLLLMPADSRPPYFRRWQSLWDQWDDWLRSTGMSALTACLGFVLARPGIDRVVVGVDSASHLAGVLAAAGASLPTVASIGSADVDLIEPYRWISR
jgi:aryl-alcohol dehydrogenase-like predicted oxidoreductase